MMNKRYSLLLFSLLFLIISGNTFLFGQSTLKGVYNKTWVAGLPGMPPSDTLSSFSFCIKDDNSYLLIYKGDTVAGSVAIDSVKCKNLNTEHPRLTCEFKIPFSTGRYFRFLSYYESTDPNSQVILTIHQNQNPHGRGLGVKEYWHTNKGKVYSSDSSFSIQLPGSYLINDQEYKGSIKGENDTLLFNIDVYNINDKGIDWIYKAHSDSAIALLKKKTSVVKVYVKKFKSDQLTGDVYFYYRDGVYMNCHYLLKCNDKVVYMYLYPQAIKVSDNALNEIIDGLVRSIKLY